MKLRLGAADAAIGASLADIDTPALLIDAAALEANIAALAEVCAGKSPRLRPHTKTHKSPIVARLQQAAGAVGVCCAKPAEAEALAADGIGDLLVTTPIVGRRKLERLARLARAVKLTVVVDDEAAIAPLADAAAAADRDLDVLVEVDVGQRRCGVPPGPAAARLAGQIGLHQRLRFLGLQGYQGKLQGIVAYAERRAAVERALGELLDSAEHLRRAGHHVAVLSGGGSGSVAIDLELGGLNELQPGSYVFMDASYTRIAWDAAGHPPPFRSALTILTSVVSRPAADRVIVDVGWKTASCNSGPPAVKTPADLVFEFAGDEHGSVQRRDGGVLDLRPGDRLELVPSHCDTTVNLHDCYTVIRDKQVDALWPIAARGCSR